MREIVCTAFGGPDVLAIEDVPTPVPGAGEVLVELLSVGVNRADLMAREGHYKLASGDPPFVPGIEGGGLVSAVGEGVPTWRVGQRVTLGAAAPRLGGPGLQGTYRSHWLGPADEVVPVPDSLPDDQLGALWLTYLTSWGCLVWRHGLTAGQVVGIPAASSGVGLAAAQVARACGALVVGLTSSPHKRELLRELPEAAFDAVVVTHDAERRLLPWHREFRDLAGGRYADVFFDPVAAGEYLGTEIRALADGGTIYVYGLLGRPGPVDVQPLIRKRGSLRGWLLYELLSAGSETLEKGYRAVLEGFRLGHYRQRIDRAFPLSEAAAAQEYVASGQQVGKVVMRPGEGTP